MTQYMYAKEGGYIFSFDLKNGYHHLDLFRGHHMYTGFSLLVRGLVRYFSLLFCVSD